MFAPRLFALILSAAAFAASAQEAFAPLAADAARPSEDGAVIWYDALDIGLLGQGWDENKTPYDRLPAHAEGKAPGPVWSLARDSAGLYLHFFTDAPSIAARWTLRDDGIAMPHMPATGVSGLDLYGWDGAAWRWVGAGRPEGVTNEATLLSNAPEGLRQYLLYLPLYNGITALEIGVPKDTQIGPAPAGAKPICLYGTSITHGACASRPGMCHTAILGRKLLRPMINLGFSGNGKMEIEMAELLAELDVACYVLECIPNMSVAQVEERVVPFVRLLREARPDTPIVLVEHLEPSHAWYVPEAEARFADRNNALQRQYQKLQEEGVEGLHYVKGESLLGDDNEGTVDGIHPNDLGFMRIAETLHETLAPILAE